MIKYLVVIAALLFTLSPAEARHHHTSHQYSHHYTRHYAHHYRHRVVQQTQPSFFDWFQPSKEQVNRPIRRYTRHGVRHYAVRHRTNSVEHASIGEFVHGLVAPLAEKVAEITSSCHSQLISGVRHTFIAGTRTISLHASGKAADVSGDYSCIYAHLTNWPGGYSVDAQRMQHVHISYDAEHHREWGARFMHGGGGHRRYAHRHYHHYRHYASRW